MISELTKPLRKWNSTFVAKKRVLPWVSQKTLRKMKERAAIKRAADPLGIKKRSIRLAGQKAELREKINRRNRVRFRRMGLYETCEAKLPGCWNKDLTWAHGKKDRFLTMREREFLVIRACTVCHHKLDEQMTHAKMLAFVRDVISKREGN